MYIMMKRLLGEGVELIITLIYIVYMLKNNPCNADIVMQ